MIQESEAFVGIDVAKLRNAIAIADAGRDGEVRYFGEADASDESMRRIVRRLATKYKKLSFCYEAGPTGYGLHRLISEMGHTCTVAAPSLIPRKPGDRIKTNRRDALSLARLLRANELTAVWVPDPAHEAMRSLVRARAFAVKDIVAKKQQISSLLLRHHRIFPWGTRYRRWLQEQSFEHAADQIVLQELIEAERDAKCDRGYLLFAESKLFRIRLLCHRTISKGACYSTAAQNPAPIAPRCLYELDRHPAQHTRALFTLRSDRQGRMRFSEGTGALYLAVVVSSSDLMPTGLTT